MCAGSLTVPGAHGRSMTSALEDVLLSIIDGKFSPLIRQANDKLDNGMALSTSAPTTVDHCVFSPKSFTQFSAE